MAAIRSSSPDRQSCQPRKRPSSLPSEAYFAAARRLPLCPAADDPASDALVPSPVSATPRDLPVAAGRRRSLRQTQIQGLSDRLLSYRHRRGSNCARQALPARRHRPNVEVRLRRDAREGGASHRGDFLRRLIAAVPYKVHTVLTDNGTHFTTPGNTSSAAPDIKAALEAGELVWAHAFEYACAQNDVDHRLTKPKHPWTNGQVERMNPPAKLRRRLQLRQAAHNPQGPHPIRIHLQSLDFQSHTDLKSARSSKCRD